MYAAQTGMLMQICTCKLTLPRSQDLRCYGQSKAIASSGEPNVATDKACKTHSQVKIAYYARSKHETKGGEPVILSCQRPGGRNKPKFLHKVSGYSMQLLGYR